MARNQLSRDTDNAMIGGVCSGIARHYGFDVTIVRIVWLVLTVVSVGTSIILYIAAWVIMPRGDDLEDHDEQAGTADRGGAHRPVDVEAETLPARERFVESGRVLMTHARQSAEEIGRIARGERAGASSTAASVGDVDNAEASEAPEPVRPSYPDGAPPPPMPQDTPGSTPSAADEENAPPPPQSPV